MTAVEFLFNELWELPKDKFIWNAILSKAKEIEREQIMNAFNDGRTWNNSWDGDTYYKELYENLNTLGR